MKEMIFLSILFSGCVNPTTTPEVEKVPAVRKLENQNYKWKTQSQIDITKRALQSKGIALVSTIPSDAEEFCPSFKKLRNAEREQFWTGFIAAMAVRESGVNTKVEFKEGFKDRNAEYIVSRGLLQLSPESANGYKCGVKADGSDLHDESVNINCGVTILNQWISRDKVISGGSTGAWRGCARYWSVCRNRGEAKSLKFIKETTKKLKVCNI